MIADKELFEETRCFRISSETSYRFRSNLVTLKLETTSLENNEAKISF